MLKEIRIIIKKCKSHNHGCLKGAVMCPMWNDGCLIGLPYGWPIENRVKGKSQKKVGSHGKKDAGAAHLPESYDAPTSTPKSIESLPPDPLPGNSGQQSQPQICPAFRHGTDCVIKETVLTCWENPCVLDRAKRHNGQT